MTPEREITRLLDVMPASGRMMTKIISKPQQATVIDCNFPNPFERERAIYINFDLWQQLSKPQRDLLMLRNVSWLISIRWLKPDLYQGIALVGILGAIFEGLQGDIIGVIVAGGLSTIALTKIWRSYRSSQIELEADEAAIKIALRRGYNEPQAAEALLDAIEKVAQIEGRLSLNFTELIRTQNLRAIAGISPLGVPDKIKKE